jgi:hypothetical protein
MSIYWRHKYTVTKLTALCMKHYTALEISLFVFRKNFHMWVVDLSEVYIITVY